ncbi:hypothetical protein QYF61_004358 [Mycteria americana]|uniref:BZIP domain-containing protein n=1 Tax=Mycteria americana TaxID=33587 RepID=A0AAN7S0E1_MYCAM|nr:hypothetical protein QYF61_004358 [Mycteria americana]
MSCAVPAAAEGSQQVGAERRGSALRAGGHMGLSHAGQRRVGGARCPRASVLPCPAGGCGAGPSRHRAVHGRPGLCEMGNMCSCSATLIRLTLGVSVRTLKTSETFLAYVFQSHEEDDRKVRRREKNRVAAQRSRKKQTQKADKLHEEYESLEQENTSLKREIGKLTDEMKHLSQVLKDHEKVCPLLHCTMNFVTVPRPDALASCLPR